MWERIENRLALLELLEVGRLRRRAGQADVWTWLDQLAWTRRTGRRDEFALVAEHKQALVQLLDRVWLEWQTASGALAERQLSPTPTDWRSFQDMTRWEGVPDLPQRLNRRTATSAVAPHSKSTLSSTRQLALGDTSVTRDGIVRLRPPPGVRFVRGVNAIIGTEVSQVLGEVAISERALLDGTLLQGPVRAALLVENLGPYQDLDPPDGWLIVHVPGWDTATVRLFLAQLREVPVVHFGDLDPAGVRIFRHLRHIHPSLKWAIPEFWNEYVTTHGLQRRWPDDLELEGAPLFVRELARRALWLEQEVIVLDPRLRGVLEVAARL